MFLLHLFYCMKFGTKWILVVFLLVLKGIFFFCSLFNYCCVLNIYRHKSERYNEYTDRIHYQNRRFCRSGKFYSGKKKEKINNFCFFGEILYNFWTKLRLGKFFFIQSINCKPVLCFPFLLLVNYVNEVAFTIIPTYTQHSLCIQSIIIRKIKKYEKNMYTVDEIYIFAANIKLRAHSKKWECIFFCSHLN